jgi:4a-hydroxytetrahydrobiopterin dehydratase
MTGMERLLTDDEVASGLAGLAGWAGTTEAIARTVRAADFPAAIRLVTAVAEAAEEADHHPDIDIRWRDVTFTLSTHSAGGVTAKDLDLAARIDALAADRPTDRPAG